MERLGRDSKTQIQVSAELAISHVTLGVTFSYEASMSPAMK